MAMLPTIDHVKAEPVADFEIVSWQTNDAKGDMPPDEFIAYCRRVVQIAITLDYSNPAEMKCFST
ncbi:MAG: hypothetical protein CM15mP39_07180 [Synechococcus sp.]|nr:MAG: hypothetical protein CM15mP39_07180 [Synechococcus sp.]